jgi:hypothetical protein
LTSLASVFVEVRPDTSHFSNELKSSLAKTREAVDVAATLDTAKLKPQLDRLKADLKSITVTKANITADSAKASATVRGLKQELKGLSEKVKLEGDSTDLSNRITAVKAELKSVSDEKVKLSVDSSAASAHIKALSAQLSVFSREEDRAGAGGDGGGLGGHLAGIASGFADAGAAMGSIMTKAGMVGPALLAAGAAASSAASAGVALAGAMGPVAAAGIAAYGGTMLAVKQGMGVVKFATEGLSDAIGGDKKAMDALTPAGQALARQLKAMKPEVDGVRQAAQAGLFPGVADAARRLATNYFPLLRTAARQTGTAMGGLAERAGLLATSGPWKRDFGTVTSTNARNLSVLGTIGLSLADVFRNLLVTSLPLTTAFLRWGAGAARALQGVTQAGRNSGALAGFWTRAAAAGAVFGRIVGNVGVALFNVFRIGSSPTGRNLLVVVEGLTERFREWTTTANGAKTIADWFAQGRTNVAAIGRLVGAVFGGMKDMGSGAAFAPLVDQIRTQVLPPLMAFLHNASASGALQALVTAVGNIIGVFAQLSASDQSLKAFAATLGALAQAAGWIVTNIPGASRVLGAFFVLMGANQALKVVGLGGAVQELGGFMVSLATSAGRAAVAEKAHAFWTGVETAAAKVAAGAAKAWAGAQWLLNAAMDANPIGLVIVGVAALAAGFILAYRKSETFRRIVDGAVNGVKDAAVAVVHWFSRSFVPFFTDTIPGAFNATVSWVKRNWPVILAVLTGPVGLATLFITRHWDTITGAFRDAKNWVVGGFQRAWAAVRGVLTGPVNAAVGMFRGIFGSGGTVRGIFTAVKDWGTGTFKRAWANLRAVFTDPLHAAVNVFRNLFGTGGTVRTLFKNAVSAIGGIWRGIQGAMSGPVNWVIRNVINRLVDAVNWVSRKLGKGNILQHFGRVGGGGGGGGGGGIASNPGRGALNPGFARGGVLPGYTPGKDVHTFHSATGGTLHLSGGEAVMRPEWTRAVGGAPAVKAMNDAARRGMRFQGGGVVWPTVGRRISTYRGHDGVDINQPPGPNFGAPIYAYRAGRITYTGWGRGYGDAVFEKGNVGPEVVYGHMSRVLAHAGQVVRAGQVIGAVGATGHASGPHLHFGVPGGTYAGALSLLRGATNVPGGSSGALGFLQNLFDPLAAIRRRLGNIGRGAVPGGQIGRDLVGAVKDKVFDLATGWARGLVGTVGSAAGAVIGGNGAKAYAQKALANYGWGMAQWPALNALWEKESGWNPRADNPTSSAYGIPQALPGSKMASAGRDWRTNAATQIRWGLGYIRDIYGRPTNAWAHSQAHNWYDDGGVARGRGVILKNTPERERVLSPQETNSYDRLLPLLERMERGGSGPVRIVLDAGGGVTLTGHIDNRIQGRQAQAATVRRQRR